ncbi:hypothetical protein SAMN02910384_02213 [Pseudobutyrivibrio sp. ACV-2]|uniref:hypothetical protein n=1 Tax=Pseudobutyrivibrio sp. ACV-2 TaxID=1520801 RepID=UPI00089AFFAD|nr:hypothetical protein [Pseudobutyrivibrio sp. ACV-2]SEA73459.1 hypothetical protein SAMN02910384_02213 [Pseudobutyrivibrio sp. ACV-2]
MKKKQIMALALAVAVVTGAAGSVSMKALAAADFTQAKTPSQVSYGRLTDSQLAIVKAHFDPKFYAEKYDDVVAALGTDEELLYTHFIMCGIFEGRKGWNDFDPSAYASAYSDVKDKYGKDIPMYYSHYYNKGMSEGRDLTTIDKCEEAGITVVSFFDENQLLSVDIFAASNLMGTADFATVSNAFDAVTNEGAATVNSGDETYVIVPTDVAENTVENTTENTPVSEEVTEVVFDKEETVVIKDTATPKSGKKISSEKVAEEEATSEEETSSETENPSEEKKEEAVVEEPHFEELGRVYVSNGQGGVKECAILVLRNGEGYEPKFVRNLTSDVEGIQYTDIVAVVPVVIFTVEEANSIIEREQYADIPVFEAESGNVIGSEGVTFDYEKPEMVYHHPIDSESSYDKMMTNYVDGHYEDNAPVSVDEYGTEETDYQISADVRADENGDAKVTTVVKSGDEIKYKATYVFEGTALKTETESEEATEAVEETEQVESEIEETVEAE